MALAGVAFWVTQKGQAAPPPPKREAVDRGDLVEKVSATGKLLFKGIFLIAPEVQAARVAEIFPGAEVGLRVEKDQPLVRLDDDLAHARLEEAKAAVHAA